MERRNRNIMIASIISCTLLGGALYLGVNSQKSHIAMPPAQAVSGETSPSQQASGAHVSLAEYTAHQAKYQDHQLIYFFKTDWCFVCNVVKADMRANPNRLPAKTVFVEVDFEKDTALRQKYNVQHQTTFVQVDKAGAQIAQWQAQNLSEVLAGIKKG